MNILILGGGGREHALAFAVLQNPKCDRLIVAPGNAGIAEMAECAAIDPCDSAAVLALCAEAAVDFVIIGPEAPLAAGVADALRAAGILTFGPSAAAARLEASKGFTKAVCAARGVPTAAYEAFTSLAPAQSYLSAQSLPIVIKADGLAAGKGVTVAETRAEAEAALAAIFADSEAAVVIEDFMAGEEASFFVLCDGETALPLASAQDHKRAFDGDLGPNTGGMGAYSPAPILTPALEARVMDEIIRPTLAEMAARGTPYQGVLYAGLMIENGAARLVEYNCRFGDPEAQVIALRLGAQLLDLMQATAEGRLGEMAVQAAPDHALTVVLAAKGYPGAYAKGGVIGGLDGQPANGDAVVFHASTARRDGVLQAMGGRVLCATARGGSLAEARARAYALAEKIDFPDGFYRRDIGFRALGLR